MNATPQLPGYELGQRLLAHPLAEIWRGRSTTGMEVVVLVLSEEGAADGQVRDRLSRASRAAALEPGLEQTPLWAANLTTDRPYAVTQLVPGQSGAERLLDPLDGVLRNDEESLDAVRSQLAQYGAMPMTAAEEAGRGKAASGGPATEGSGRARGWLKVGAVVVVLVVFCGLYSVGAALRSEGNDEKRSVVPGPGVLVSPGALPSPVLLPGTAKPK
ncbi:hypothetical protein [Kribbella sp. NPDC051620]|uniref:hypothetical protein n=1 Tax=Kribbella sp. NPDC051620 TaxID=3364120 RepID=UPI00379AF58C